MLRIACFFVADEKVLYPIVANVARKATVTANATCGEIQPEYYCRLMQGEFFNPWESQFCFVCDARSPEPSKKHPIENVIDGGEAFWQSPSLAHGMKYDYVTITLDLKQVRFSRQSLEICLGKVQHPHHLDEFCGNLVLME